METNNNDAKATTASNILAAQTLYHGTKANLKNGDLIAAGFSSNYGKQKKALYVYLSATIEAATWVLNLLWVMAPAEFI